MKTYKEIRDWLADMLIEWDSVKATTTLRKGQFLMNELWNFDKDIYDVVQGIDSIDCFYDDSKVDGFVDALNKF